MAVMSSRPTGRHRTSDFGPFAYGMHSYVSVRQFATENGLDEAGYAEIMRRVRNGWRLVDALAAALEENRDAAAQNQIPSVIGTTGTFGNAA
jgi:hypothetical protein